MLALAKQVDGILLCSPRMSNSLIEQLSREVPLVVVNRLVTGLPAVVMDVGAGRPAAPSSTWSGSATATSRCSAARAAPGPTGRSAARPPPAARAAGAELTVLGPNPPTEDGGAAAAEHGRCGPASPPCSPTTT